MSELAELFTPITFRNCTVKNRITISGHINMLAENGLPNERELRYHEARAKGGFGLIVMIESFRAAKGRAEASGSAA